MKRVLLLFTVLLATLTFAQVPSYVPSNGLVGWWGFNGNAYDESGNSNNGVVYGAALTSDRKGNPNSAYEFDGVDDYIDLGVLQAYSNYPTSYTQLAWLKFNDLSQLSLIGTKRFGSSGWATPVTLGTELRFYADDTKYVGAIMASATIDTNVYYLTCFVKDNNSYKIFIDGVLVDSVFDAYTLNTISSNYYIGYHPSWGKYLNGTIDCFGLWDRALSAAEINEYFNATSCQDSIQTQPASNTFQTASGTAHFTTAHTDSTATYQWQQNTGTGWTNLSDFGIYSGTTTDSLVLTGITTSLNGYGYRCLIDACTMDTTDVAYLTVVDNIGIEESAASIIVSPNPTNGFITVDINANYSVYSMTGQKVAEGKTEGKIDLSNLPAGSYKLILTTKRGTTTHPIQKI